MELGQLDDDKKNTCCQDSIDRVEGEEKLLARDIRSARAPFLISSGEKLDAADESPDGVTKSNDRESHEDQDEHLNGPVIFLSGR